MNTLNLPSNIYEDLKKGEAQVIQHIDSIGDLARLEGWFPLDKEEELWMTDLNTYHAQHQNEDRE